MKAESTMSKEIAERPADYVGPNLDPQGLVLEPEELAPGVYALMANQIPKDNNGVIVGRRGALVVDAGINGAISRQIQEIVGRLTEKPILFLANTTYHGDHTFGNEAFPESVHIISSRQNRESMRDLDYEKRMRSDNLRGNLAAVADVTTWRRPDIVFDHYAAIDLGGVTVELWHFGAGNAPGDTVVYVPGAKVAWTGNFLVHAGIAPMLLEGGPGPYLDSLRAMQATLDVKTIIPGHGPAGDASAALSTLMAYLEELQITVRGFVADGIGLEEALEKYPVPKMLGLPAAVPKADELNAYNRQSHRLNVLATYKALEGEAGRA